MINLTRLSTHGTLGASHIEVGCRAGRRIDPAFATALVVARSLVMSIATHSVRVFIGDCSAPGVQRLVWPAGPRAA